MKNINSPEFKFVVVGGGTAGWLTALYMRMYFPQSSITVIESSNLGILGAGEGTTPHFHTALKFLNINISDFIRESHATIKNGIQFTNWHGDRETYFHPFSINSEFSYLDFSHVDRSLTNRNVNALIAEQLAQNQTLDEICFMAQSSKRGHVVFTPGSGRAKTRIDHFRQIGRIGFHFNANRVADYFKRIGTNTRRIQVIDTLITNVTTDDRGNITHLHADGLCLPCDFVFDCSGFHRLLIGKHFQSRWNSYQSQLPVNKALPFFLPETEMIPPYTDSIAMRYGWMWRIPVQGRYGCGYVFDSRRCSDDDALQEVATYLGTPVDSPRTFRFEPGSFEQTWIRNCVALGLSSGFLEPLEATSIMVTVLSLEYLFQHLNGILFDDEHARREYNDTVTSMNAAIRDFLYFHYLTHRSDSEFWTQFRKDNVCSSEFSDKLENIRYFRDLDHLFKGPVFSKPSYLAVGAGTHWFDMTAASHQFKRLTQGSFQAPYQQAKQQYHQHVNLHLPTTMPHRAFLEYLTATEN